MKTPNLSFYFKVGYFHTRYWCSINRIFLYHQSTQFFVVCCICYITYFSYM